MKPETADKALKILLRIMGSSSLTALIFVAAPHSWMTSIHSDLGLGEMPQAPIVWYLARSTSAFYALLGGLFWLVSFDLERHRRVLGYIGVVLPLLGATLFVVDYVEGLPASWTFWEGPFTIAVGLAMFWLNRVGRTAAS